jgi:hypothetical protein
MPEVKKIHKLGSWGYQYGKEGTFRRFKEHDNESEQRALKRAIKDGETKKKIRWSRSNIIFNWLGI